MSPLADLVEREVLLVVTGIDIDDDDRVAGLRSSYSDLPAFDVIFILAVFPPES